MGSTAGSGSGSGSSVPASASVFQESDSTPAILLTATPDCTTDELFALLGIHKSFKPTQSTKSASSFTIFQFYDRWTAADEAYTKYQDMINQHTWNKMALTKDNVTGIFLKRSSYYNCSRLFSQVHSSPDYDDMLKWLETQGKYCDSTELWGETKSSYTLAHLYDWIKNKGTLDPIGKKKKAAAKEKELAKGKAKGKSHKKATTSLKQ